MKNKIFGIFFCLGSFSIHGQSQNFSTLNSHYFSSKLHTFEAMTDSLSIKTSNPLSITKQNYTSHYNACLGAFCKLENKVLNTANVPIRMRLGSTEYVDALESKVPAYRDIRGRQEKY